MTKDDIAKLQRLLEAADGQPLFLPYPSAVAATFLETVIPRLPELLRLAAKGLDADLVADALAAACRDLLDEVGHHESCPAWVSSVHDDKCNCGVGGPAMQCRASLAAYREWELGKPSE